MANRVFIATVVVLWLTSMSWLMMDKILPSLFEGQPPRTNGLETGKVVAWNVAWSGRPVGCAASVRMLGASGTTEIHNRVILEQVPLLDLAPAWMSKVVGDIGEMSIDASTRIEFDPLDHFSAFDSRVSINGVPAILKISGRLKGSYLELKVRTGDLSYAPQIYLPDRSAFSEALFPVAELPNMYVGRRWQEEVYSPFRSPSSHVKTVQAEVVSVESLQHEGESMRVMRIEYRGMPRAGMPDSARLQAVTWVEPKSGLVYRQDVYVGSSKLRFERLSDAEAQPIGKSFFTRLFHLKNLSQTSSGGGGRPEESEQTRGKKQPAASQPKKPERTGAAL